VVFLFKDKSIINIFFLAILSVGIHIHFFTAAPVIVSNLNDGFFSYLLRNYIASLPQATLFLLYHGLVIFQAIRLNLVLNDLKMFQQSNYVPAMTFVLLTGLFPAWSSISPALLSNLFLIWLFTRLCRLFNQSSPKTLLFNTGLILALGIIFYRPTAMMILVVLYALVEIRPFNLAEWLVLLMGVIVPYYFLASWFFLKDEIQQFATYMPYLSWNLPVDNLNIGLWAGLGILLILVLVGLYCWQLFNQRMIIQIRKNWGLMLMFLLLMLLVPFIFSNGGLVSAFMALVPITAFVSNAFSYPRKLTVPNVLFWLCIAVIAYNNWLFMKN
jgi:hypothetical protein